MDMNIVINSGLSGFVMIDRILEVTQTHIRTEKNITENENRLFSFIEILAQTGAFHARHLMDFKRHAFLLGIRSCTCVENLPEGCYTSSGHLLGRSSDAFQYELECSGPEGISIKGRFNFAACNYNERFKQDILEKHYRDLFTCLTKNT